MTVQVVESINKEDGFLVRGSRRGHLTFELRAHLSGDTIYLVSWHGTPDGEWSSRSPRAIGTRSELAALAAAFPTEKGE